MFADELDIDMKRLVIVSGDTRVVPDEGVTAGSQSMQYGGVAVRLAAAELRAYLIARAAEKLGVDAAKLKVVDGTISGGAKSITYWDLVAGQKIDIEATGTVKVKEAKDRRYIGKKVGRLDIPPKATGSLIFIQDLRPEGMLHGRVVRPPAYGAKLISVDRDVSNMPGVKRGEEQVWNAQHEFSGPVKEKLQTHPFTAWERLTQALLMSNELIYVN